MKTRTTSSMLIKAIVPVGDSLNRWPWRRGILFIALALALAWLALSADGASGDVRPRTEAMPTKTPLRVRMRSSASQPASITRQWVLMRSLATQPAAPTRPAVSLRSLATQPASPTRPSVSVRSLSNTTGSNNTASGLAALASNTTGSYNTANGVHALFSNTTGS